MANSYRLPNDPSDIDRPARLRRLVYTREHGANQRGLEEKLARLDHGEAAAVFGTGMAALHAAFFTILDPGDHAIVSNVVYMRVAGLFADVFPRKLRHRGRLRGIADLDAVRAAVRPRTKLVHTEVIANPDLRVADVAALASIAHDAGALLDDRLDLHPPPMMRPLDHGADLVIDSLTKYYNGHGDAMGGVVTGARELVEQRPHRRDVARRRCHLPVQRLADHAGIDHPSRCGSRRQCHNAQAVAELLAADPRVVHVSYPGLPGHDQHDAAVRQLDGGFGGVWSVSFAIGGTHADRLHLRQRPASHHLRRLPRPRRDARRLRGVPARARPGPSPSRSATTDSCASPSASRPRPTSSPTSTRP